MHSSGSQFNDHSPLHIKCSGTYTASLCCTVGIRFKNAYYTCSMAIREQWFLRANQQRPSKVTVAYDPRNVNKLYIRNGVNLEPCQLKEISKQFEARNWADVQAYFYEKARAEKDNRGTKLQQDATLNAQIEHIVTEAEEAFTGSKKTPKSQRVANIRENRKAEQAHAKRDNTPVLPLPPEHEPDYIGPASHFKLLKQQREEEKEKPNHEN